MAGHARHQRRLRIDADARVLGNRVPIIDGLYAAGNTSASVLGSAYPGGGSCIGPSVTMGYRAGRHVARSRRGTSVRWWPVTELTFD